MTVATPVKPASVGTLIDKLWALREEKKELEAKAKAVAEQMEPLEEQLSVKMAAEGVDKATGRKASASFSFAVSANVGIDGDVEAGWKALYAYIKKTGYWHLLQRRVTDTSYRELLDTGKKVPGLQPFTKKRINLRTLTTNAS